MHAVETRPGRTSNRRARSTEPGELAILSQVRARAAAKAPGLRLGIGDDCALLRLRPGEELAVTTDLSIAGRHFRLDWHPPESIGHRALARGLSDLAAMGARPLAAFLSLGLPRELTGAISASGKQRKNLDLALLSMDSCLLPTAQKPRLPAAIWPSRPSPWLTSCWWARFLAAALCSAPAHGPATCSTSPAAWAAPPQPSPCSAAIGVGI